MAMGSTMNNPMINKLARLEQRGGEESVGATASYGGIAFKTLIYLILTGLGVALQFLIPVGEEHQNTVFLVAILLTGVTPFLAWLIKPLTALLGMVYSLCQGYVICWASVMYAGEYRGIVFAAIAITLLIILVMLFLYTTRIVKVGHRFKAVVGTLFLTSLLGSGAVALSGIIAPNNIVMQLLHEQGSWVAILGAAISVLIATLFLLSDFETVERTVQENLPKKYEWMAAFGLVITVLWLYLKILNLIASIAGKAKGNSDSTAPTAPAA